jgi:recombination protein RecT
MATLAIIERIESISANPKLKFMQALTQALPPQSMILAPALVRQAITIIKGSDSLQRCSEFSLLTSIAEVAQCGLSLDLHLGQCYLVPFSNVATVMYGYRGLIELARRSGEVLDMVGEIRYSKDQFQIRLGTDRSLMHVPLDAPESKRGERLGAYAIATLARSGTVFEYMDADQILRIRNGVIKRKKSDKPSVWETEHENEMWRKTAIRRLAKRMPQSPALIPFVQAAIRDEYRQQEIRQVVEMPPAINEALAEAEIVETPLQKDARESKIKSKPAAKPTVDATITPEQVKQIQMLVADLNLETTDIGKEAKALGHTGPLAKLPSHLFKPLAEALEKRSKN